MTHQYDDQRHLTLEAYRFELLHEDSVLSTYRGLALDGRENIQVTSATNHAVVRTAFRWLNNEFSLRDRLDSSWARKPSAVGWYSGAMVLVYPDDHEEILATCAAIGADIDGFLDLADGMVAALAAAHNAGIVHCALTPSSFLVDKDRRCRLSSFGRAVKRDAVERISVPAMLEPAYMSPEHTGQTSLTLDERSDLYSFGVVLFELLTGQLPFRVAHPESAGAWVHAHLASEPALAHQLSSNVPPMLSHVLSKLLAKAPQERYQTSDALAADLRRCRLAWAERGAISSFTLAEQDLAAELVFPTRLYGRENAFASLLGAFARVRGEQTFGVSVVHGPSGIGKSSLLAQLLADLHLRDATIIHANADQYRGDAPYAALVEGLRKLVSGILAQSDAALAYWRGRVVAELSDAELTLALIPELKMLLDGAAPSTSGPVPDGSGRVAAAVLCLLRAFATPERPLVLAVDNAQWLDTAAVLLLEQVISLAAELPVMLLISARSRQGHAQDESAELIPRLTGRAAYVHEIELEGLSIPVLQRMLADTFGIDTAKVEELAVLVHHKTEGHPYFVRQFLRAIVDDGLVSHVSGSWQFALDQIQSRHFTDNMVGLALQRLICLPLELRPILGAIAGLGQSRRGALLHALSGLDGPQLGMLLAPALASDILVFDSGIYAFTHDRLQEVAYEMLDPRERRDLHYRLGCLLAAQATSDGRDDTLFHAVDHLAQAQGSVLSSEAAGFAQLAASAGQRARRACAYESAVAYLRQALSLLRMAPEGQLGGLCALDIEFELVHCLFLTGQIEDSATQVERLLGLPIDRLMRGRLQGLAVDLEVRRGRYHEATVIARSALLCFGIDLPADPTEEACDEAYAALREHLSGQPSQVLHSVAVLENPEVAVAFRILSSLLVPASFTSPRLLFLQLCSTLQLTLQYGMTPESTVSLAWLGIMVCERYRAFEDGFAYADAARTLVARHGYVSHEAQVLLALDQLSVWTQPLEFSLECAQAGFDIARAQGDFTMACFEACHRTCLVLNRGDALETVRDEIARALSFVTQVGFADVEAILRTQQDFVDHLRSVRGLGDSRSARLEPDNLLNGGGIEPMSTLRFWRWLYIGILDYLEGDIARARACLEQASHLAWSAPAHIHLLDFHLFSVLVLCGQEEDDAERLQLRERILAHVGQIEAWAASNPATFSDKLALAQGALHQFDANDLDALHCYERAASHARAHGFEHIAGIAHECAAALAARNEHVTAAAAHVDASCQAYRRWGALGKVARLENAPPYASAPDSSTLSFSAETAAIRDIDSVIRSARALSEEIHPIPLVHALMKIALEYANAQRGLLIRKEGEGIVIQAGAVLTADGIEVDIKQSEPGEADLPLTMVHTAMRTRMAVSISGCRRPEHYALDPYLVSYPRCAAIVIPMLKRSQLVGMLYLENRLSSYGFTGEHTQVLSLLAAQAAVSLETAQLYTDLVEENRERRRVEKALRESRATLLLGERINKSGSWTWEVERGVLTCSTEFCRIFDLDERAIELEFKDLMQRVHPGDRPRVERLAHDAVAAQRPLRFEHRITGADGRIRHLFVAGQPMEDNDANVYVGTVSDITRRKIDEESLRKAQTELARSARMTTVGQLTAAIAHEVNQPLMSISANAGAGLRWLRRDPARTDQVVGLLEEIVGQSQRAGKIIQTLQTLGHRKPRLDSVDLHKLIRDTLVLARAELERHEIVLELDLQADRRCIEGDAVQLQQVLVNLINNAMEAMAPADGRDLLLRVASHSNRGRIEVLVEDNGIGVDEVGLDSMFEPFVSGKPDAMGMGLAVCRSIIEAHGGTIFARQGRPHGCTVTFTLPEEAVQ